MNGLQIDSRHHDIVLKILKDMGMRVYVFGSRAKNNAKTLSDLDLCIMDEYPKASVRKLKENFEESNLPFKVDVVVWSELDESFRETIKKDLVEFK